LSIYAPRYGLGARPAYIPFAAGLFWWLRKKPVASYRRAAWAAPMLFIPVVVLYLVSVWLWLRSTEPLVGNLVIDSWNAFGWCRPRSDMLAMQPPMRRRVNLLLEALGLAAVIGAVLGSARGVGFHTAPLPGAILGGVAGALNGMMLIGTVGAAEIFLPRTRLGHALERTPFVIAFLMKFLVYGIVTVCVIGGRLGRHLAVAVAAPVLGPDLQW